MVTVIVLMQVQINKGFTQRITENSNFQNRTILDSVNTHVHVLTDKNFCFEESACMHQILLRCKLKINIKKVALSQPDA